SHRQLIILNTPISKEVGVFFYMGKQSIKNY
ncbi:ankyrin repeat domain-containing protein, partial [Acinetobacter baumannii]